MQINELLSVTESGAVCAACGPIRLPAACEHASAADIDRARELLSRPPRRRQRARWEAVQSVTSEHENGTYELVRLADGTMGCSCLSFVQSNAVMPAVYSRGVPGVACKHLRRHLGRRRREVRSQPRRPSLWQKYLLRALCAEAPEAQSGEQAYYAIRRGLELQGVRYVSLVGQLRRQEKVRLLPVWAFGVEIEGVGAPQSGLTTALSGAGLPAFIGDRHSPEGGRWKVTYDGSVHGDHPFELVSPKLFGDPGFGQLRKACRATRAAGGGGNASCGLHVHVDAFNLSLQEIQKLARLWHAIERPILHRLVSPSRRHNSFCKPLDAATLASIERARSTDSLGLIDRYRSLNVAAYDAHRSLEIRLHQHSLNARKIGAWVTLHLLLVSAVKQGLDPAAVRPEWPSLASALGVESGTPLVRSAWRHLSARLESAADESSVAEAA